MCRPLISFKFRGFKFRAGRPRDEPPNTHVENGGMQVNRKEKPVRLRTAGKRDPFYILRNSRRRFMLKALMELNGEACLRELVRRVANYERVLNVRSVRVSILQNHIPKMVKAGLIEYDPVTDTVKLLELPPEYSYYLEAVGKNDIPWSLYYTILAAFGLLISLTQTNLLATIISASFLTGSILHTLQVLQVRRLMKRRK